MLVESSICHLSHVSVVLIKRKHMQKSNKNEIFMGRVKNSNCLNFAHKSTLVRKERLCIFFPQICFYFREKWTFRFHPLESMNRVITGRKLNTFACFAFQRYYIKGNLTKVSSFIDSSSSVKWNLCRNWLLRSFWPCEKAMCSLPLQKNVGEENPLFSPCAIVQNSTNYVCKLLKEWSSKWRKVLFGQMFSRDTGNSSK